MSWVIYCDKKPLKNIFLSGKRTTVIKNISPEKKIASFFPHSSYFDAPHNTDYFLLHISWKIHA